MDNKLLTTITLFILLNGITVSSQKQSVDSLYAEYFKNSREIPYLHFNKTSFLKGEEVWFKAYVLDLNTQKLHINTSNLYCGIYDSKGDLKEKKMLYIKNGMASGSFKIDSTYTNKNYYVKAFTNYMRNFEENESFLQKITIVNNTAKKKDSVFTKLKYDLQILPEGGHVLANVYNMLGVILKDEKGKEIRSFTLNQFGLGKVTVLIETNKEYIVKIILENGKELLKKVPSKKLKGVTLRVEDISSNMMKIVVKTNKKTLLELENKKFYILIHNTNSYFKKEIKFKKDKNLYYLFYKKKLFKYGTNIVTLFNDKNKPLAERVFFNHKKSSLLGFLDVSLKSIENDSIILNLDKGTSGEPYYLSASVLPFETKVNNPSNTIYSKLFLQPYIKGRVKNSAYYFQNINRKKLQELDLLLLTQGWSKYNWYNIFNSPPIDDRYKFEKGISIKGTVDTGENPKNIYLVSNGLILSEKTDDNIVEFKNLYLKENDTVNFSYLNKGTLEKQKGYFRMIPISFNNKIKVPVIHNHKLRFKENNIELFVLKENEVLNEVEIKGKLKKKFKNAPFNFGLMKGYKLEENDALGTVSGFIRSKGFRIQPKGILGFEIQNNRNRSGIATRVFLNNFEITEIPEDIGILIQEDLKNFEEVFVTKTFEGEIHFFRREISYEKRSKKIFNHYKIPFGFSVEKEYYQPKYASTNHATFKEYGAVYWKPDIIINSKKTTYLKFPRLNQKKIKVFIEGITEEGKLIYKEKVFNRLDKENN